MLNKYEGKKSVISRNIHVLNKYEGKKSVISRNIRVK